MADPADLPTGTVTFLFTDLEGSTALLQAHPDAYRAAVARHHALLRGAVEAHGGAVFETVGDAVYAAFHRPTDAVAAALEGQLALGREAWGTPPLRVRMGVHLGEAEAYPAPGAAQGARYLGLPLVRCARLMATAHGGQTVLSEAVTVLVRDALPPGAALRDLGEHRLKDLQRPERVAQLTHPALPGAFPPLRSLDARPHNLPLQLTSFVGREREVAEVAGRLARPDVRLLTLTGPAGTGKTRLALQAAAELLDAFPEGAFLVSLAPLSDPALIPAAAAAALGVRAPAGRPPLEALRDHLRDKRLLLVLDNFEHLLAAAPLVVDLLAGCPGLKALVTSRAVLRLTGEHALVVPPLAVPDPRRPPPAERLPEYEAVQLFVARARAARADFALTAETARAVAAICQRLDGLPLALELAAARTRHLPPPTLLARLESAAGGLPVLADGPRDAPARQRTLRAALAWSHALLDAGERALFARLAVFAGGWTPAAAEAVGEDGQPASDVLDGLGRLADHSLVRLEESTSGEPRFGLLETVREYAAERLAASGEEDATRQRHAGFYLALAERAEAELGPLRDGWWLAATQGAEPGPRGQAWLDRLEAEHDNLLAALRWLADQGRTEDGLRLAGALGWFWFWRGYPAAGLARLTELLSGRAALAAARRGAPVRPAVRQKALLAANKLDELQRPTPRFLITTHEVEDTDPRPQGAGASSAVPEPGDERTGQPQAMAPAAPAAPAAPEADLADQAYDQGDHVAARRLYDRELDRLRREGNRPGTERPLWRAAGLALAAGDSAAARRRFEELLALYRQLGDQGGAQAALYELGHVARQQGDRAAARAFFAEHQAAVDAHGRRGPGTPRRAERLAALGLVAADDGDHAEARALFRQSLGLVRDGGDGWMAANALDAFAGLAAAQGQPERAVRLAGAAAALRRARNQGTWPVWQQWLDQRLDPTRRALTQEAYAAAWAEGQAMSLEQAVADALEDAPASA
jgi:predicted ATPase/class 3 adenylate cyclase/TolA-binding protein